MTTKSVRRSIIGSLAGIALLGLAVPVAKLATTTSAGSTSRSRREFFALRTKAELLRPGEVICLRSKPHRKGLARSEAFFMRPFHAIDTDNFG